MADKPVTREEKYLAYLTGDYTGEIPKPITRKEKYLYKLCVDGIGTSKEAIATPRKYPLSNSDILGTALVIDSRIFFSFSDNVFTPFLRVLILQKQLSRFLILCNQSRSD